MRLVCTINDDASSLSPRGEWLFAFAFWMAGLAIIALALGWIPAPPEYFHAPRWVVAVAGAAFVSGGFAPLAARLGPASLLSQFVGGGVVVPLTLIANWVAFGPGSRQFSGGLSIGGLAMSPASTSELAGRVVFGFGAVLLDIFVIAIVIRVLRGKKSAGN